MLEGNSKHLPAHKVLVTSVHSRAGVTSLIHRYRENEFLKNDRTVGLDFSSKEISLLGTHFKLQFWDANAQERFPTIKASYYRGSEIFLLCHPITKDLYSIPPFLDDTLPQLDEGTRIFLIGTQCDLADQRKFTPEEGRKIAEKYHFAGYRECSAKTGEGVQDFFSLIEKSFAEKHLYPSLQDAVLQEEKTSLHTLLESGKADVNACRYDSRDFEGKSAIFIACRKKLPNAYAQLLNATLKVDLCRQDVSDADIRVLVEAMKNNTTVQILDLSGNRSITSIGARELAKMLAVHKTLTRLLLNSNSQLSGGTGGYWPWSSWSGIEYIANGLRKNPRLIALEVQDCNLNSHDVAAIATIPSVKHVFETAPKPVHPKPLALPPQPSTEAKQNDKIGKLIRQGSLPLPQKDNLIKTPSSKSIVMQKDENTKIKKQQNGQAIPEGKATLKILFTRASEKPAGTTTLVKHILNDKSFKDKMLFFFGENPLLQISDIPAKSTDQELISLPNDQKNTVLFFCHPVTEPLDSTQKFLEITLFLLPENLLIFLVGTQADLAEQRKFSFEDGKNLAKKYNLKGGYHECSAKTGNGVQEVYSSAMVMVVTAKTNTPNHQEKKVSPVKMLVPPPLPPDPYTPTVAPLKIQSDVQVDVHPLPPSQTTKKSVPAKIEPAVTEIKEVSGEKSSPPKTVLKTLIIGRRGAGKTAFLSRYLHNNFSPQKPPKSLGDFEAKDIQFSGENYRLHLWEIKADEIFSNFSHSKNYISGAQIVFVCHPVFACLDEIPAFIKKEISLIAKEAYFFLVATQSDLAHQRKFTPEEGRTLAKKNNFAGYWECSAKTGEGIEHITASIEHALASNHTALKQPDPEPIPTPAVVKPPSDTPHIDAALLKCIQESDQHLNLLHFKKEVSEIKEVVVAQLAPLIAWGTLKIDALIGSGSYGDVYRGRRYDDEVVAIKVFRKLTEQEIKDFRNETRMMMKCQSPQIVRVFGMCDEPDHYALVMEDMPHGSLYQRLEDKQRLPWAKRWDIAINITKGLRYLHDNGIVHGDLKSHNILFDSHHHAKISNFRFARNKFENTTENTHRHYSMITKRWCAPEVFDPSQPMTTASDIYSLGVILLELVTRQPPFGNYSEEEVIRQIQNGKQNEIPADCPKVFAEIIKKCWLKIPKDRPTADQILSILTNTKPDRPWTFEGDKQQGVLPSGKSYSLITASEKTVEKVRKQYELRPFPGYIIDTVEVIYNPRLLTNFLNRINDLQRQEGNPLFASQWAKEKKDDHEERAWRNEIKTIYETSIAHYHDDEFPDVAFSLLWHGTFSDRLDSLCTLGYANLKGNDGGFFVEQRIQPLIQNMHIASIAIQLVLSFLIVWLVFPLFR